MDVDNVGDDFGGGGSDGDGDSDDEDSDGGDIGGGDSDDDDSDSDDSGGCDSDDDDSDGDDSGGGDSGGGDSLLDAAKSAAKSVARVVSAMYAGIMTTTHSEANKAFVEDSRRISKQKNVAREGTAPRAPPAPGGIGSVPLIAKLVSAGLRDTCSGDLEIKNGVSFNRTALSALKPHYDMAYAFNPADTGVVVQETKKLGGTG
ncbi:unnamed protein product [Laminaria digitata]